MFHLTNLTTSDLTHRPLFLPILCLLTFFGSITGLVFNSLGYFNSETLVNRIASKDSNSHLRVLDYSNGDLTNPSIRVGNITVENYKKFSIGGAVSYILCLAGSVLMFKGKRNGFYSLVLGVFFSLISHFLLFGDNFKAMGLSMLLTLLGLILVFVFYLNLKYLEEE
jgi:hypothetical protein